MFATSHVAPFRDTADFYAWQEREEARKRGAARTAAGRLALIHGGDPDATGELRLYEQGQRIMYGTAEWVAAVLPPEIRYILPTREGLEQAAAHILEHAIPPHFRNVPRHI